MPKHEENYHQKDYNKLKNTYYERCQWHEGLVWEIPKEFIIRNLSKLKPLLLPILQGLG